MKVVAEMGSGAALESQKWAVVRAKVVFLVAKVVFLVAEAG